MTLSEDIKWIKGHLITLIVAAVLIYGAIYGVLYIQDKDRKEHAAELQQFAETVNKQNQQFQQTVKTEIDQLVAQNAQLEAQNQTLIEALAKRQVIEAKVPIQAATLSASEAARTLGGVAQGDNILLDLDHARAAVTNLQLVPLLRQDKADLEKSNGLLQTEVSNAQQALDLERKAHSSDKTADAATIKSRDAEISKLHSDARKGKLKWFGIGFVVGYITATAQHIAGF